MRTPETTQEVTAPQENSSPRTTALKQVRKAIRFHLGQPLSQARVAHDWEKKPNMQRLPWEGTKKSGTRLRHFRLSGCCLRHWFRSCRTRGADEDPAYSLDENKRAQRFGALSTSPHGTQKLHSRPRPGEVSSSQLLPQQRKIRVEHTANIPALGRAGGIPRARSPQH